MVLHRKDEWPIDRTLPGATTPDQSGPGSNGNERVQHIPQSFKIEASPLNGSMSYPGHSLEVTYPSAEMQSVYSTAPANWVVYLVGSEEANDCSVSSLSDLFRNVSHLRKTKVGWRGCLSLFKSFSIWSFLFSFMTFDRN